MRRRIEVNDEFGRGKEEELLRRIEELQLDREKIEIMRVMLISSYFLGGVIREHELVGDNGTSSEMKEFLEVSTYEFIKGKKLGGRQRSLACDLASYGHNEGRRLEGRKDPYPESFARMMKAVS